MGLIVFIRKKKVIYFLLVSIFISSFYVNCSQNADLSKVNFQSVEAVDLQNSTTKSMDTKGALLFSDGNDCTNRRGTLSEFRNCIDLKAKKANLNFPLSGCYYGFTSKAEAELHIDKLTESKNVAVVPFAEGSSCREAFPDGYILLTKDEFAARKEADFKLPISYNKAIDSAKAIAATYSQTYLEKELKSTNRTETTCNGKYALADWNSPASWAAIGYAAELFRSAMILVTNDPWRTGDAEIFRNVLVKIADHIVKRANSTYFLDAGTKSSTLLGWNNLASPWDAWKNGTCSPAGGPNAWASGWALHTLAQVYKITQDTRYLNAFIKGSTYWHMGTKSSVLPQLPSAVVIKSLAAKYGPNAITSTYTVGGSRFLANKEQDSSKLILRYHYHPEDPGKFAINVTGILSLAMITAGESSPSSFFKIADGKGGSINRTFANLGFYSMYSVYGNLKLNNYGYTDVDDIGFTSSDYEQHFEFSDYYLARAGSILKNKYFTAVARQAALDVINGVEPSRFPSDGLYFCLIRELDPKLLNFCKERIHNLNAQSPNWNKNFLNLYAVVSGLY